MSAPTVAEFEALTKFCKEHGIRRLKAGEIEMEFGPDDAALTPKQSVDMLREFLKDAPSDESMLYWSSGMPAAEAEREVKGAADGS